MIDDLRRSFCIFGLFLAVLTMPPAVASTAAAPVTEEFVRGYVSALVKYQFQGEVHAVIVSGGTVYLHGLTLPPDDQKKLIDQLKEIEGVEQIIVASNETPAAAAGSDGTERKASTEKALPKFLPQGRLFQSLLADPRWPHFSAAYQRYQDDRQLKNVGATSFGEIFSIYRFRGPAKSVMELGIEAGVFAIFDLDAESSDLINADYLVGIPLTIEKGAFASRTSVFHQSSHLGDEFLLRGRTDERVNLSYESIQSLLSYQLPKGFRAYAGGGYIFRADPSDLDRWSTQCGLEFRSPWAFTGDALRPVAAVDIQHRQESDWNTDLSARAGVQFENPDFLDRKMLLLIEYYRGKSPHGQFYEKNIEHLGAGLHFFLD
jgi:hypothetical protein